MYSATCLMNPEHKIASGEWALYARGVGAICRNCYVDRLGDKAIVLKDLKLRELKKLCSAYRTEADRLSKTVEMFNIGDKITKLLQKANLTDNLVMDYLKRINGTAEETKALEEITRLHGTLKETCFQIQGWLEQGLDTKNLFEYDQTKKIRGV